jgi:hypothetical protein
MEEKEEFDERILMRGEEEGKESASHVIIHQWKLSPVW